MIIKSPNMFYFERSDIWGVFNTEISTVVNRFEISSAFFWPSGEIYWGVLGGKRKGDKLSWDISDLIRSEEYLSLADSPPPCQVSSVRQINIFFISFQIFLISLIPTKRTQPNPNFLLKRVQSFKLKYLKYYKPKPL